MAFYKTKKIKTIVFLMSMLLICLVPSFAFADDEVDPFTAILYEDISYNFMDTFIRWTGQINWSLDYDGTPISNADVGDLDFTGSYPFEPNSIKVFYSTDAPLSANRTEMPIGDYTFTKTYDSGTGRWTVKITGIDSKYNTTIDAKMFYVEVITPFTNPPTDPLKISVSSELNLKLPGVLPPGGTSHTGTLRSINDGPHFGADYVGNKTIFTGFSATKADGTPILPDEVFTTGDSIRINYDWSLYELGANHDYNIEGEVTAGDYFVFDLPTGLKLVNDVVKAPLYGPDGEIYGYLFAQANTNIAMVVFNHTTYATEQVKGDLYFGIRIEDVETLIKEGIKVPISDGTDVEVDLNLESKIIDISKQGGFGRPGFNEINWTVVFNETKATLKNAIFLDETNGSSKWDFSTTSPNLTVSVINDDGSETLLSSGTDYYVSDWSQYRRKIEFKGAYATLAKPIVVRMIANDKDVGNANASFSNKATITADGEKSGEASTTLKRSDLTLSKGVAIDQNGQAKWTVQYNSKKQEIPFGNAILTDTLQPPKATVALNDWQITNTILPRYKFDDDSIKITKKSDGSVLIKDTDYKVEYVLVNVPLYNYAKPPVAMGVDRECWQMKISFLHDDDGNGNLKEHYVIDYITIPDIAFNDRPEVSKAYDIRVTNNITDGFFTAQQEIVQSRIIKTLLEITSPNTGYTNSAEVIGKYTISANEIKTNMPNMEIYDIFASYAGSENQDNKTLISAKVTATKPNGTVSVLVEGTDYSLEIASEADPITVKIDGGGTKTITGGFKIKILDAQYENAHIFVEATIKINIDKYVGSSPTNFNTAILNANDAYINYSQIGTLLSGTIVNNGYKAGSVLSNKNIRWNILFNGAYTDMDNPVLSDVLTDDLKFVPGSVRVLAVETEKGGATPQATALSYIYRTQNPITDASKVTPGEWTSYDVTYDEDTREVKVQFNGKATRPYLVYFDTERVKAHASAYRNTAKVTSDNGPQTADLNASVSVPDSGSYAAKTGAMAGSSSSNPRNIKWELILNKTMLQIDAGLEVKDTLDPEKRLILLPETLIVTKGIYTQSNNTYTKSSEVLVKDTDYTVIADPDDGFKIIFINGFSYPVFVEYETYAAVPSGTNVRNSVKVSGTNVVAPEQWGIVRVAYSEAGGGGVSGNYTFNILKVDADGGTIPLAGARFRIWDNATRDGFPLDTVTTDKDGKATMKVFKSGTYYVEEFEAPPGYRISNASENIQVEFTADNPDINQTITNEKDLKDFEFTKVDSGNDAPLAGAKFTLYKYIGTAPYEAAALEDDSLWTESGVETSAADGKVAFMGREKGVYKLYETKAPQGYQLPLGYWVLDVGDTFGIEGIGQPPAFKTEGTNLLLPNHKALIFPLTGGGGTLQNTLIGLGLIGMASILLFSFYKKKNRLKIKKI
ncbi:MAG: MSCRAMM family protein [Eubacteriaceae bacterium]